MTRWMETLSQCLCLTALTSLRMMWVWVRLDLLMLCSSTSWRLQPTLPTSDKACPVGSSQAENTEASEHTQVYWWHWGMLLYYPGVAVNSYRSCCNYSIRKKLITVLLGAYLEPERIPSVHVGANVMVALTCWRRACSARDLWLSECFLGVTASFISARKN